MLCKPLRQALAAAPRMENPMISYAQNFEDVMIARLFDAGYRGFYVDIGAAHPDFFSVTRHFYNQGWSGINVEPTFRFYPLLRKARPNDINLQCAVGNSPGRATFYEFPKLAENSTLDCGMRSRACSKRRLATPCGSLITSPSAAAPGQRRSISRPTRIAARCCQFPRAP